jgi:hypothetical protein
MSDLGDLALAGSRRVGKCLEVANQNPGMLPRAFDMEEFGRDVALDDALLPIAESIRT